MAQKFGLQAHLDLLLTQHNQPQIQEPATASDFAKWQTAARTQLTLLLGLENRASVPVHVDQLSVTDRGAYVEEKYSLEVGEAVQAPLYLLIPKTEPPYTPVLAFHGHDPSVRYILGQYPDEETAVRNHQNHNNYAQALAQAGYLVCAVEQRGMGERITSQTSPPEAPRSCRHLAFSYMLQGRSLLGERCWDAICAINYLQTRPDVRQGVLGCTGHSGGGTTALFLSAIEERMTAVSVSCYFCSFEASILGMPHCECNYLPGVMQCGDMGDIASLIAPRPLCLINGRHDLIFPIHGTIEQFETVKRAYEINGRSFACHLHIHEGAHVYNLPASLDWFNNWLT